MRDTNPDTATVRMLRFSSALRALTLRMLGMLQDIVTYQWIPTGLHQVLRQALRCEQMQIFE